MQNGDSILYVYRKYQDELIEKEKYKDKLERLEKRYLNLSHAFNLHIDICKATKGVFNDYN